MQTTLIAETRLSHERRETAAFGTVFSDHILISDLRDGQWEPGRICPYGELPLPPAPSALHYGQAIFEGFKAFRLHDGRVALFRPRDNWLRLNRSALRLAMPTVPEQLFLDGIAELVRVDEKWIPEREGGSLYIRPVYFAIDETLQVRPAMSYRFLTITSPVGPYFSGAVNLIAEERYVRAFPGGTGDIKPAGNYAGTLVAAREAQERGYHNVLWLDGIRHQHIEECGLMNIMFVINDRVVTPALSGTILPGITRDSVITLLKDRNIAVEERTISINELFAAASAGQLQEAVGVGTAATIIPIGRIRYRDREIEVPVWKENALTCQALRDLESIRKGTAPDKHEWLFLV
jgi:branched-chain amino acid aminotransferase